jgi:hypothetical protein
MTAQTRVDNQLSQKTLIPFVYVTVVVICSLLFLGVGTVHVMAGAVQDGADVSTSSIQTSVAKWIIVALLAFLALVALMLFFLFIQSMRYGSRLGIESHWGGFGGGLGGWRLSRSLAYLVSAIVLVSIFGLLSSQMTPILESKRPSGAATQDTTTVDENTPADTTGTVDE